MNLKWFFIGSAIAGSAWLGLKVGPMLGEVLAICFEFVAFVMGVG